MTKRILAILTSVLLLSVVLCACGGDAQSDSADPTALIIGQWYAEDTEAFSEFNEDGTCSTVQYGETIYSGTYTVEKIDDTTILVTTDNGQAMEISFIDENTFVYDGSTIIRVTEENQDGGLAPAEEPAEEPEEELAEFDPEIMVVGVWAANGSSIEFYQDGSAYTVDEYGETSELYYTLEAAADGSFTITLFDAEGNGSSEVCYFVDDNTLVIGDSTFYRA